MTTLNEKRRALISEEIDTTDMDSQEIEQVYNRLQLKQADHGAVTIEQVEQVIDSKDSAEPSLDLDSLASTLLTGGMDTFKRALVDYIKVNTPIPELPTHTIETKTVTITLDSDGNQVIPDINPQFQNLESAAKLFGLKNAAYEFPVCDYDADKPDLYDMRHMHKTGLLKIISVALEHNDHMWIYGEKATGKTTLVQHIAAKTKRPFYRIQHHAAMEPKDLVGSFQIPDGKSKWHDGALTKAIRTKFAMILLDEPTVNPAACQLYQSMLDEGYLTIEETGERVYLAEGVSFFATDNTNGHGDTTGRYNGTSPVNGALVDRFMASIELTFMDKKQEASILNRYGINDNQAMQIADYAARIRKDCKTGAIEEPISLRRLISFAKLIAADVPQELALSVAILNQVCHAQDKEVYKQIANAHLPDLNNV